MTDALDLSDLDPVRLRPVTANQEPLRRETPPSIFLGKRKSRLSQHRRVLCGCVEAHHVENANVARCFNREQSYTYC
jgi:hypothetical protein